MSKALPENLSESMLDCGGCFYLVSCAKFVPTLSSSRFGGMHSSPTVSPLALSAFLIGTLPAYSGVSYTPGPIQRAYFSRVLSM